MVTRHIYREEDLRQSPGTGPQVHAQDRQGDGPPCAVEEWEAVGLFGRARVRFAQVIALLEQALEQGREKLLDTREFSDLVEAQMLRGIGRRLEATEPKVGVGVLGNDVDGPSMGLGTYES
jgi:hypothetical protein